MYGKLTTVFFFLSSCFLCSTGIRDPRFNAGKSANEDVLLAGGGVELTPEQIHLSYLGDPTEMWVTWVSWNGPNEADRGSR